MHTDCASRGVPRFPRARLGLMRCCIAITREPGNPPRGIVATGPQVPSKKPQIDRRSTSLRPVDTRADRKSTRLNSSHGYISYAVFCLKKKVCGVLTPCKVVSAQLYLAARTAAS